MHMPRFETRTATPLTRPALTASAPVLMVQSPMAPGDEWVGFREHIAGRFVASEICVAARQEPVAGPAHLVAAGFGAGAALRAASQHTGNVRSLTLFAPAGFSVPHGVPADLLAAVIADLAGGQTDAAAETWCDAQHGPGTWRATSAKLRARMCQNVAAAAAQALDDRLTPLSPVDLAGIVCPVLVVTGAQTPPAMRAAGEVIAGSLPFVERASIAGAAAQPHLTDPHLVHPLAAKFLGNVEAWWHSDAVSDRKAA